MSIKEAAAMVNMSPAVLQREIDAGKLETFHYRGRVIVMPHSLAAWGRAL